MPTKLNRAGNQQNYVPKGNGDASGEYGDNVNGSNRHFKVFEKPKDDKSNETKINEIKAKIDELVENGGTPTQLMRLLSDNDIKGDLFSELGNYFSDKRAEKFAKEQEKAKQKTDEEKIEETRERLKEKWRRTGLTEETKQREIDNIDKNWTDKMLLREYYRQHPDETRIFKPKTMEDLESNLRDISHKMFGKNSPNFNRLIDNIKSGNPDKRMVSIMANLYDTNDYTMDLAKGNDSCFYSREKRVQLGGESLYGSNDYNDGEVFFHESGHALDYTSKGENGLYSMDFKSKKYNMSLQESINDELSIFKDNKEFEKLVKEKDDYQKTIDVKIDELQSRVDTLHQNMENHEKTIDNWVDNKFKERFGFTKKELIKKAMNKEITMEEYKQTSNMMYDVAMKVREAYKENSKEFKELSIKYNNYYNQMLDLDTKKSGLIFKKYGDLSDMIQAINGKKLYGGHDDDYFLTRHDKKQGTECFAEITSAIANNPESLGVLKKYIPRTLEIYNELIGVIENGK